ncbi:putative protein kinase RLK-Pelle-LRR-XII-1 family [Helianthus annuus]|nr:putative protein kinase RLK-Pelle-LRR-XII-1 family [Helianthus annuus]
MNSKHPIVNLSSFSSIHFLFYSLVISLSSTVICGGIETDHEALLKIKSLITRDPYGALTSWNDSLHLCDWSHVYCGKRHRRVTYLNLSSQGLEGSLSPHVGNLSFLHKLSLGNNSFHGAIPQEVGRLSRLRRLYLYQNKFNEVIPTNISGCFNLEVIALSNNELVGSIPKEISSLTKLTVLSLFNNKFTGGMPTILGNITSLEVFSVTGNPLGGSIPNILSQWKNLREFYALGCNLHGTIPHEIGHLSRLTVLNLETNKFYGVIPTNISGCSNLEMISLSYNELVGSIPKEISSLTKLTYFSLDNNSLTGGIPPYSGNMTSLEVFSLKGNPLGGTIPDTLGLMKSLKEIYFGGCNLYGTIPKSIYNLSHLVNISLADNQFTGGLYSAIGEMLPHLVFLQLWGNQLSGPLPASISNCTSLKRLELGKNKFSGHLTVDFSKLTEMEFIDIEDNLFGSKEAYEMKFIDSLKNCTRLKRLAFNSCKFQGVLPRSIGVFANKSAFSVLGNRRLCGGIIELGLPKCKETSKFTKKFHLYLIVTLIASALFTATCLAYAWCKKKRKTHLSQSSTRERHLKVSYSQLLKATNGFSESNLIGTGGYSSVYKGILFEDNDTFVAIKVLHLQNRGAQKSFMRECEAWRNLRHRNLLKIITSCSSIDFQGNPFKALVYEFMPNGSLHDWLHSSGNTSRLNLLQMIKILMDVAYALDYIHNHCLPTIIHGDLKPSNILLDNDMVAHVGDFGLARFLGTSYQNNSTGIRGTMGYIAPEYGLGSQMTSNGDIYSFGILVLEAMTGKHPTDDIFNEDLSLHKFASMALLDNVIDITDVNILNLYQEDRIVLQNNEENAKKMEECLTLTIKIGVACSVDSPTQRMDVKMVVRELQRILDTLENI